MGGPADTTGRERGSHRPRTVTVRGRRAVDGAGRAGGIGHPSPGARGRGPTAAARWAPPASGSLAGPARGPRRGDPRHSARHRARGDGAPRGIDRSPATTSRCSPCWPPSAPLPPPTGHSNHANDHAGTGHGPTRRALGCRRCGAPRGPLPTRQAERRSSRSPLSPTSTVEPSWPATPSGRGRWPTRSQVTSPMVMVAAITRLAMIVRPTRRATPR